MVVYELLSLRSPYFEIIESDEIRSYILNGALPTLPDLPPSMSPFISLMKNCLQLNPFLRPNARSVVDYLIQCSSQLDQVTTCNQSTIIVNNTTE